MALIEAGADVNARGTASERSALHRAFSIGYGQYSGIHLEVASALIEAGADVSARDYMGQTPIFQVRLNIEGTLELIKAGAEVNITDKKGNTPLSEALRFYDFEHRVVMTYLIAAGADVHNEAVMKALRKHPLLKEQYRKIKDGNLLHLFSEYGFVEAVKACINAGYDVNARYEAVYHGKPEYSYTPLQILADSANTKIYVPLEYRELPFLQDYLVSKDVKNKEEIASILIEAGADPNLSSRADNTPLALAIESGYISLALMLIEAGAEVENLPIDISDEVAEGGTLLHYAADGNFIKAAEILIAAGADASIKNSAGNIPFCLAYKKDHTEVAEIIRPEGFGKTFQWFKCL